MLKNILKLNGAQELSKKEQKSVVGSGFNCKIQKCCRYNGAYMPCNQVPY